MNRALKNKLLFGQYWSAFHYQEAMALREAANRTSLCEWERKVMLSRACIEQQKAEEMAQQVRLHAGVMG